MRHPALYFLLTVFCLILWTSSCTPFSPESPRQDAPATINIAFYEDSLLLLPLYIAQEQDYFRQEKLTINFAKTEQKEALTELAEGNYDLLVAGAENAFYAYHREEVNRILLLGKIAHHCGYFLLTRSPENPFSGAKMKGKTIICPGSGENTTLALVQLLAQHNLRPFLDVHLLNNLPLSLQMGTFLAGTAQFILAPEPRATLLEKEETAQVISSLDHVLPPPIPLTLLTSRNQLLKNNETYQNFLSALAKGLIWLEEHTPEEVANLAQQYFPGIEEKILLRGICRYKNLGSWSHSPYLTTQDLESCATLLQETKELPTPLPLLELFVSANNA